MKEKYLELLKKKYSNLGLSQEVLNLYAERLSKSTDDGAEDSVLESNVAELEPILKAIQSYGDKRATKAAQGKGKGEGEPSNPPSNEDVPGDAPDWFKQYMTAQAKKESDLKEQIESLKAQQTTASFDAIVLRVGKELKLEGDMLELAKAKLSADMDENAIRASLGATKELLIKHGAMRDADDTTYHVSEESAMAEEAKTWLDEKLKSQQNV